MILKSKETKETRIFLGEEERRRRKKGPIESRVHELKRFKISHRVEKRIDFAILRLIHKYN